MAGPCHHLHPPRRGITDRTATHQLILDTLFAVPPCPDGTEHRACRYCDAAAIVEALENGAPQ